MNEVTALTQTIPPASEEVLQEEGIVITGYCMWRQRKLAGVFGDVYLTSKRITFKRDESVSLGLIGFLFRKHFTGGKFEPDIPLSSITRGSTRKYGWSRLIVLDYEYNKKQFVFRPDKKDVEHWVAELNKLGVQIQL